MKKHGTFDGAGAMGALFAAFLAVGLVGCPDKGTTTTGSAGSAGSGNAAGTPTGASAGGSTGGSNGTQPSGGGTPGNSGSATADPTVSPASNPAVAVTAAAKTGTIRGHVHVGPNTTPLGALPVQKDPEVCGPTHDPGSLKFKDGLLEGCIVYLKGPAAPADWDKRGPYEIDQHACHYSPRVSIVPIGATVTFKSSDPVLHNVSTAYKSFNKAVSQGQPQYLVCDEAAFAPLQCNIHPFMAGLLVVAENPWYRLTDSSGAFSLENVPVGTWKLVARHEILGKASRDGETVVVTPGKIVEVEIKFE